MANQKQDDILEKVVAMLGEHFEQYFIVVSPMKNALRWSGSDQIWSRGAAECYLTRKTAEDYAEVESKFSEGE